MPFGETIRAAFFLFGRSTTMSALRDFSDHIKNVLRKSGGAPRSYGAGAARFPVTDVADAELHRASPGGTPSPDQTGADVADQTAAAGVPPNPAVPSAAPAAPAPAPVLKTIRIPLRTSQLILGYAHQFVAQGEYFDGKKVEELDNVYWFCEPKDTFISLPAGGLAQTLKAGGPVKIYAMHMPTKFVALPVDVTVIPPVLKSIRYFGPPEFVTHNLGKHIDLLLRGTFVNDTEVDIPDPSQPRPFAQIEWRSDNDKVVKVDQNGGAWAVSSGNAKVTAEEKKSGKIAEIHITVRIVVDPLMVFWTIK
jgi:hypothetical protein